MLLGAEASSYPGARTYLTWHRLGGDGWGVLFIVKAPAKVLSSFADRLAALLSAHHYEPKTRDLHGRSLHEHCVRGGDECFSYFTEGRYFVGSFASSLVEEAIGVTEDNSFPRERPRGLDWIEDPEEHEKLYFTAHGLSHFLGLFRPPADGAATAAPLALPLEVSPEISTRGRGLYIRGDVPRPLLSHPDVLFGGPDKRPRERPIPHFFRLVSNACASVWTYSFADAHQWNTHMLPYWRNHLPALLEQRLQEFSSSQLDFSSFFGLVGQRAGVMQLALGEHDTAHRIFFLHTKDKKSLTARLWDAARKKEAASSPLVERYNGHEVWYLPVRGLPYLLFGAGFEHFSELYYLFFDDFLVASSSLSSLKIWLDSVEFGDTWASSADKRPFLERTISTANWGLYVDLKQARGGIATHLSASPWRPYFAQTAWSSGTPMMAFEATRVADKWYAHVFSERPEVLCGGTQVEDRAPKAQESKRLSDAPPSSKKTSAPRSDDEPIQSGRYQQRINLTLAERIVSNPKVVYSPEKGDYIVFLQTRGHHLHAFLGEKLMWEKTLEGAIVSPIYPLDYRRNNQRQYLLATPSHLHLLWEDGRDFAPFPVSAPSEPVAHLSLLDYDKNRRYRFLVADASGKTFITDKKANPLPGWSPNKVTGALSSPPFHVRLPGRDAIVSVQEKGVVGVFRRRGVSFPSFPVDLQASVSSPPFVIKRNTWRTSQLVCVTDAGTLVTLNFSADATKKELPSVTGAHFGLIKETLNRGYLVYRWTPEAVVLFDASGRRMFEKNLRTETLPAFQFYNFGLGEKIVVITDKENEKTYLYDARGQYALPSPIESAQKIGLVYSVNKRTYVLYGVHKNKYFVWAYPRP